MHHSKYAAVPQWWHWRVEGQARWQSGRQATGAGGASLPGHAPTTRMHAPTSMHHGVRVLDVLASVLASLNLVHKIAWLTQTDGEIREIVPAREDAANLLNLKILFELHFSCGGRTAAPRWALHRTLPNQHGRQCEPCAVDLRFVLRHRRLNRLPWLARAAGSGSTPDRNLPMHQITGSAPPPSRRPSVEYKLTVQFATTWTALHVYPCVFTTCKPTPVLRFRLSLAIFHIHCLIALQESFKGMSGYVGGEHVRGHRRPHRIHQIERADCSAHVVFHILYFCACMCTGEQD